MGFGSGLALSSKFPQQNYARDNWMYEQKKKAKKAAEEANSDATYQKYLESIHIDPSKIHRWDVDEARNTYAKGLAQIDQLKQQNPNTWKNQAAQVAGEIEWKIRELYNRKPKLDADEQAIAKFQTEGSSTEGQDQLRTAMQQGKPTDFGADPYESAGIVKNEQGRYETNVRAVPKVDFQKEVVERIGKNPSYQAQVSWYQANMNNMPSDVKAYVMRYGMPRNPDDARKIETKMGIESGTLVSTKDIITDMVEDPMYFLAAEQNVRDHINKEQEKYFKTLDADGRREYVSNKLMDKYHEYGGAKYDIKMVRDRVPPRATQAEKNAATNFDVTVNYNADDKGNEVFSPSFKGVPEPKTYTVKVVDDAKKGTQKNHDIVGVADKVEFKDGKMVIFVKDSQGTIFQTAPSAANLTQIRAQWGFSPYEVRNEANKKAGHKDTAVHPSTIGMVYGNIYKGKPQKAEGITTPPKGEGKKKSFPSLSLEDKKSLQKQSGAKTKAEFADWLKNNGYTF